MTHNKLLEASESLLRSGQLSKATENFKKIALSKISTTEVIHVAQLARRTGQISAGIKIMQRQLSQKHGIDRQSLEFKAEYANLLTLFGCVTEALDILTEVTIQSPPEALLAKAWCLFEVWEFSQAIPLLKKYVRVQKDDYLCLAGSVNLAEAFLGAGDVESAIKFATKAISDAAKKSYTRLQANALHVRAQAYEQNRNLSLSDKDLTHALELIGNSRTSDAFLIHRQVAINEFLRLKKRSSLQTIKKMASDRGEFESLRLCDLKSLQVKFNNDLFNHLYIGSPYKQFRTQLSRQFPNGKLKKKIACGSKKGVLLDLSTPEMTFKGEVLEITPQLQRLLLSLLQDLYAPMRVGGLYSNSFPGTHYIANHSPMVVHQALKRLRQWFEENQIPLAIVCTNRKYRLIQESPTTIVLSLDSFKLLEGLSTLQRLRRNFGSGTEFSLMEAAKILNLSKASTHRALVAEIYNGEIEMKYQGRNTKYVITR
ncbi:MAG: tetratricopeptide repeat protein [Bdellovibrio sp.]